MTTRLRCNQTKKIFGVLYREGDVVKPGRSLRKLLVKEDFTEVKKTSKQAVEKTLKKKVKKTSKKEDD